MECLKWQEMGLLFVSGETDGRQSEEFKEHIKVCAECKQETDQYYFDKQHFFLQDLLGEAPRETIDEKIKSACSQKPIATIGWSLFSGLWIKKALVATFFLVFGMSAGIYFTIHYFSNNNAAIAGDTPGKASPTAVASKATTIDSAKNDKKDSLKSNDAATFPSAHKSSEGIITVDLKKE
jgi:hypothetical protein